jgi:pilus assembly protein CpaB
MSRTRRRGLLLLCFALVSGGLAASEVHERERTTAARVGPAVAVAVAARELAADHRLTRADMGVKRVPARFVPPDALGTPGRLAGARTAVRVPAGAYLTAGLIRGATARDDGLLRPGQRAVELPVGGALTGAEPGARVDVVVSTQTADGTGRTVVALEDVELLALRTASGDPYAGAGDPAAGGAAAGGAAAGEAAVGEAAVGEAAAGQAAPSEPAALPAGPAGTPTALATLRVTPGQAVYLTAAANFAHEVRLLLRPPGDRKRIGAAAVAEGQL